MNHDPAIRALELLDRLPGAERRLIEALSVHDVLDRQIIGYTARALALDIGAEQVAAHPFVRPDALSGVRADDEERYVLQRGFRTALIDRLRAQFPERHDRAHRLASVYYHEPLEPLRTDRLDRYVKELRHLAAVRPEAAVTRLASFAHSALLGGHAEAAGRAATAVTRLHPPAPEASLVAGTVKAVAEILSAPDNADHHTVMALDRLLSEHPLPQDRAAMRIVMLGSDLVAYYTERRTPSPSLTAAVMPAAVTTVDPTGLPAGRGWDEFHMVRELREISATITTRTHRLAFTEKNVAHHEVRTKLSAVIGADPHGAPRRPVIVDLVPWHHDTFLDGLHLRDRNGRPVNMMTSTDVKTHVAREVHQLLTSGGEPESDSGGALVRRLHALAWTSETDEITAVLQRAAESGSLGDAVRERIRGLIRHMPVVALVDTHPGMSSEVTYAYDEPCEVRRTGWGAVSVSTHLRVPPEVRQNRLDVVTPAGLELAGPPRTRGEADIRLLSGTDAPGGVREFSLDIAAYAEHGDRLSTVVVDLPFVVPRALFSRTLLTSTVCTLIALASGLLSFVVDPSIWPQIVSLLAAGGLGVDNIQKIRRAGEAEVVDLRTHAEKPLNRVKFVSIGMALGAALMANLGNGAGQILSFAAALTCAVLSGIVFLRMLRRRERWERDPRESRLLEG
ncbi:hypothetical protein [Streptomyces sp. NPDC056431]|uniref:hypothetical protein n=1 Tax=Streptomyces sp. NPDC056431 TaxID=3345814 RepID=UPI0036AAD3B0